MAVRNNQPQLPFPGLVDPVNPLHQGEDILEWRVVVILLHSDGTV